MKRLVLCLLMTLCFGVMTSAAQQQAQPTQLTFCYSDTDVFPWHMSGEQGLNFLLLNQVSHKLDMQFKYISYPWNRCLMEMKNGRVDGAFVASFVAERLESGRYPTTRDKAIDPEKRMMSEAYYLYRLKNASLDWDGKKFSHLNGSIGITIGASVTAQLKEMGVKIEEVSGKTEILFDMLIYGRVQGVIMFTQVGDYLMRTPRYQGKFEKIPTQIVSKPYYLMLSHQLYANYPTLANQIWASIAEVREATTYKKVEEEAISAGH